MYLGSEMIMANYGSRVSWNKFYNYAKAYYEHHGNLEVPFGFKTNDGVTFDSNGEINLGTWISHQRQAFKKNGKYNDVRAKLLEEIGMRFDNKINNMSWEEFYNYAKAYYECYGNLEVPVRFKTNDGINFDLNGKINLGSWVHNQRQAFRKDEKYDEKRVKLLNEIGMVWDSKDMIGIKKLCFMYGVDADIEENKTIINHMSLQEFIYKVGILKYFNEPITYPNGVLNEVFFMSVSDLKARYEVSFNCFTKRKGL